MIHISWKSIIMNCWRKCGFFIILLYLTLRSFFANLIDSINSKKGDFSCCLPVCFHYSFTYRYSFPSANVNWWRKVNDPSFFFWIDSTKLILLIPSVIYSISHNNLNSLITKILCHVHRGFNLNSTYNHFAVKI